MICCNSIYFLYTVREFLFQYSVICCDSQGKSPRWYFCSKYREDQGQNDIPLHLSGPGMDCGFDFEKREGLKRKNV